MNFKIWMKRKAHLSRAQLVENPVRRETRAKRHGEGAVYDGDLIKSLTASELYAFQLEFRGELAKNHLVSSRFNNNPHLGMATLLIEMS